MPRKMLLVLGAMFLLGPGARASDPIGIYAVIYRVEVEPSTGDAERIRIWGTFALADKESREYTRPMNGMLLMKLPAAKAEVARQEWKDFQKLAGSKQCVGFGARHKPLPKVRKADVDPSKDPDVYPLGFGLTKLPATDAIAKELLAEQSKAKP
jgi:hypothetical protein